MRYGSIPYTPTLLVMTLGQRITASLEEFTQKLQSGEPIEAVRVKRFDTPDGPMHVREKVEDLGQELRREAEDEVP